MTIKQMIDYLKCQYTTDFGCRHCSLYSTADECGNEDYIMKSCIDILERIENNDGKSATKCFDTINNIKEKYDNKE